MNLFGTVMLLFLFLAQSSNCFNFFKDYSQTPPEQNVQDLTVDQINHPTNAYVNYNLGVALYQTEKFDQAKSNFQRALIHAKNRNLKERCHFNLANSLYKIALSRLPSNWMDRNVEIEPEKITNAIQEAKECIKNYENVLELNKENIYAKNNLEKGKDLLKKLQEKLRQKQNKQQDKNDESTSKDKDQDQGGQQGEGQQQDSSMGGNEGSNQQDEQQHPTQGDKNGSGQASNESNGGNEDNSGEQEDQKKEQQEFKHDNPQTEHSDQSQNIDTQEHGSSGEAQTQADEKGMANGLRKQENAEEETQKQKSMRVMLDNLQSYESGLNKVRVMQKTQGEQKNLKSNQRPW